MTGGAIMIAKQKDVYLELADKPLLTLKEFCTYLGIGQTKARELIRSKDCTFSLKIGNRWYINKRLLDKWLSKKTLKKQNMDHKYGILIKLEP